MALFPIVGAAVAYAGGDKLAGSAGYERMFRHLGWSQGDMQVVAAAEVAGGLLMLPRATRHLGGALVAAASASMLVSELRHDDGKLAASRGLVLLLAVAAWLAPVRSRPRRR